MHEVFLIRLPNGCLLFDTTDSITWAGTTNETVSHLCDFLVTSGADAKSMVRMEGIVDFQWLIGLHIGIQYGAHKNFTLTAPREFLLEILNVNASDDTFSNFGSQLINSDSVPVSLTTRRSSADLSAKADLGEMESSKGRAV